MEDDKTIKERAEYLQKLVRERLAPSVQSLIDSARGIPSDRDFFFFNNFEVFRRPVNEIRNRSQGILTEIAESKKLWLRPSPLPADPEDAYNWFVDLEDDIVERIDASMDEFRKTKKEKDGDSKSLENLDSDFQMVYGKKARRQMKKSAVEARQVERGIISSGGGAGSVKVAKRDKKTTGGLNYVPFHVPTISKPQNKYNIIVDNSNSPFQHKGLKKTEDGSGYVHPLLDELNRLEFFDSSCVPSIPVVPCPWDSTPFQFIETIDGLNNMAAELRSVKEIAVDLEHNQYRSYQGITCLMQISTRTKDFVVDTLVLNNHVGPCLRDIFANPSITKVMHGSDRDILWLQRDFGIFVCNLFDTGQASRVLQLERNSLEFLLREFCGVNAEKEYQTADWRLRPLPSEMMKYARTDTHYLLYVHDIMKEKLASAQNESKGNLLFEVYKRSSDLCLQLYEKELLTESSFLHIYGLYDENFTVEQLCVIAGLYEWRDRMARMEDESTGYVLPNRMLLKIAKRMPDTISALHALVKRKHPYVERDLSTVFDVIKTSKQTKLKVVENLIEEASKLDANRKGEEKRKEFYNSQALPTLSVEKGISDSRMPLSTDTSAQKNTSSIEVDETEPITFSTEKINDQNSMEKAAFFFRNDQEAVKVGLTCTSSLFKRKSNHPTDEHRKPSSDNSNNMAGKTAQKDLLTSSLRQGIFSQSKGLESMAMETEDAHVLTTNSKCSNDFIPDMTESPVLHHGCPDKTVDEIKGGTQVKITSVQGKKLSRGLASMLGSSVSKSRTDADSKACDNEQDSVKTKLEQIKASITLPFGKNGSHRVESLHQMLKSGEASDPGDLNVQMDNFSESKSGNTALVSHEEAQVEVHLPMDTKIQCSSSDTQNDTRLVSMSRGIITKDGKKFRTWWPPFENNVLSMVTDTSEVGGSELPLSLSELRLKMQRRSKGNNCFKFIDNGSLIVDSNRDGLHNGRKRKGHSQRGHDVTNSVEKKDELAPFDYTAARQSMGFTLRNEFMNNSKGSNKSVNKHSKKGKEPGFDPMSRISADDVIQPGKRRQVFPSSGNRSATFR